jgi:HD-GYP domain-containing protein (c-di-GMP phosphodiesterase class II)
MKILAQELEIAPPPTKEYAFSMDASQRRIEKLNAILSVARALTAERDLDRLLTLIVDAAANVVDADRCTLFIVDREKNELWSRVTQREKEIRLPMGVGIAGTVAARNESLNVPDAYADARFNRHIDLTTGYRTQSILCVPMRSMKGEVVGVLQALNHSQGPFSVEDQELLEGLGAQAASAIENAMLYEDIARLFEGFIRASVVAIEARDPTTSGHSERVAVFTVGLADAVAREEGGRYRGLRLSNQEMRELRYAALLHDFGKVGVRENVLLKEAKLFPNELQKLEARFREVRYAMELGRARAERDLLARHGPAEAEPHIAALTADFERRRMELEDFWRFIRDCNTPRVLEGGAYDRLREIAQVSFVDIDGAKRVLLEEAEVGHLSIPRGSLSDSERREIESHVTHTYNFLSQIPWTRELRRVPEIAYAHHEKLDGKGYPRALPETAIPVQSRMMTIADIYDALTAADRPYKKALPHERALDILVAEAKQGKLDEELLRIFIAGDIPRTALRSP